MPRSITIILMDDLVDSCRVGIIIPSDRVGRRRYRDHGRCATEVASALSRCEVRCEHDRGRLVGASDRRPRQRALPYGRAGEEIPDILESLLQSAMPTLPGAQHSREQCLSQFIWPLPRVTQLPSNHHQVKLSLLLILIGGVSSTDPDKNPIRGQSHLLIVGDSSTGKSQLLLFASKIAMRSVITSGLGTTRFWWSR